MARSTPRSVRALSQRGRYTDGVTTSSRRNNIVRLASTCSAGMRKTTPRHWPPRSSAIIRPGLAKAPGVATGQFYGTAGPAFVEQFIGRISAW